MKSYKKSIHYFGYSSFGFTILSTLQLIVNLYYKRDGFVIFFAVAALFFLGYTIMLMVDLLTKETKLMHVTVIEANANSDIIKVLKPNGTKRKIRVLKQEVNTYQPDQELVLTLTKRTGHIKEINSSLSQL